MGMSYGYDMAAPRDEETSVSVILPQSRLRSTGGTPMAVDLGMSLIDTDDVYGPCTNEELVGWAWPAATASGRRWATKVGVTVRDNAEAAASPRPVPNGRPEHIRKSIDESLGRLGTDHVDLYQLHRVDPEVPVEESWGALAETMAALPGPQGSRY